MLHAIHIAGLAVAPTAGKQLKHRLPVAIDIRNLPREFSNALFKKVFEAFLLLSLATIWLAGWSTANAEKGVNTINEMEAIPAW